LAQEYGQWSSAITDVESLGSATRELGITQIMKIIHVRLKNKGRLLGKSKY
jgi:hypothetical protein